MPLKAIFDLLIGWIFCFSAVIYKHGMRKTEFSIMEVHFSELIVKAALCIVQTDLHALDPIARVPVDVVVDLLTHRERIADNESVRHLRRKKGVVFVREKLVNPSPRLGFFQYHNAVDLLAARREIDCQ